MKLLHSDKFLIYRLIILALLAIMLAVTWFSLATPATSAPAPTATPAPMVTPTPENHNHCMMLTSGVCYIIYPANCEPGELEIYGDESAGLHLECE